MRIITKHCFSPCFFQDRKLVCSAVQFEIPKRNPKLVLYFYKQKEITFQTLGFYELDGFVFFDTTTVILNDGEKLVGGPKKHSKIIVFGKRTHTICNGKIMQVIKTNSGKIVIDDGNIITIDEYNQKIAEQQEKQTGNNKTYQKTKKFKQKH